MPHEPSDEAGVSEVQTPVSFQSPSQRRSTVVSGRLRKSTAAVAAPISTGTRVGWLVQVWPGRLRSCAAWTFAITY